MTMRTHPPPRGGVGGTVFLVCFALAVAGLVFDLAFGARPELWIVAQPGAAAAIGVGAAFFAAIAARLAQLVLPKSPGREQRR
jgi:hypothetical protein